MVARSRRKSSGRGCRSVAMMTERPVIGSFLNSGTANNQWLVSGGQKLEKRVESTLKHFNRRAGPVEEDRHHIETARALGETIPRDVVERQLRDPPAFQRG